MEKLKNEMACLTGNELKLIAMITMFIDHFAVACVSTGSVIYLPLRAIGRIAFPIYCFLLAEGFFHTKDVKKYLIRIGILIPFAEIPFDYVLYHTLWYPGYQNVLCTLFIGLLSMTVYRMFIRKKQVIYAIMTIAAGMAVAYLLHTDYGAEGVLLIFIFYLNRYNEKRRTIFFILWGIFMGYPEVFCIAALIPVFLYNGERGRGGKGFRTASYLFYPVHLILLCVIGRIMTGL